LEVTLKIRIASQELAMQSGYLRYREFALNELQQFLQRPQHDGQGMVEYALILVLIAIVVIVILSTVGKQGNNVFSNISKGLGS
jgi:pilus assembly protein Flp/PilA